MRAPVLSIALVVMVLMANPAKAADVLLHAAGSLREALTDVAKNFEATTAIKVQTKFGPSGMLKDEIAGGARAEVFASANMEHPRALARTGKSTPVVLFARNRMCALVRPGLAIETATLLDRLLDPQVKVATSTPKADPSGDYAWDIFRKADTVRPGAFATLEKKALQLVGGPQSPPPPPGGRLAYGAFIANGTADVFLTYCTNAAQAQKENPGQQIVALPDTLAVGANYGLTVMSDASPAAYRFALYIASTEGQKIMAAHGFSAPGLPQ